MHNINISFIESNKQRRRTTTPKGSRPSKTTSRLLFAKSQTPSHIFIPNTGATTQIVRKSSYIFDPFSLHNGQSASVYRKQSHKNQLQYQWLTSNIDQNFTSQKQKLKNEHEFNNKRDRSHIIHSRINPNCQLWKRNGTNSGSRVKQRTVKTQMGSASCLNNPQDSFIFPQSKKLSLTRKCDKILAKIIPQESVSALVHKSRNEKGGRKYWGRTYRPWSPQRRFGEDAHTIDHFIEFDL